MALKKGGITRMREQKGPKLSSSENGRSRASSEGEINGRLVLDPAEVMRSMFAAKGSKGKERDTSSSDSEADSEEDRDDSQDDHIAEDTARSIANNDEGSFDLSDAESSTSARRRWIEAQERQEEDLTSVPGLVQDSKHPPALSRVCPSEAPHETPKSSSSPFDHSKITSAPTFASLGLSPPLIEALAGIRISAPTEIQTACIPAILQGRDCIGGAKTGSGKTLAFALPIVHRIARDPYGIWAVILTPTRELAYQLSEQFLAVGKPLGLSIITVVGGMDMMVQARELEQRPHIVVATPGRLCDILRSDEAGKGKLGRVQVLVLDEVDRLLTPTFAPDLGYLFSQMPLKRQTCLFTATISDAIMELAKKPPAPGKQKPFVYRVESDTMTVQGLKQKYLFIPSQIRDPYLVYLLQHPPSEIDVALRVKDKPKPTRNGKHHKKHAREDSEDEDEASHIPSTIIFTQRCATAHLLHLLLEQLDVPSVPLHSHLTQPQRLASLARFRAQEIPVLVTTDVGSRGLDIPQVAMVVNWDCPRKPDDYVHRVGRTARAGRGGVAVTVVTEKDVDLVQKIEAEVGVKMEELDLPEEEVLEKLNAVSTARRLATMEMHDTGFGERQATNKAKAIKRARRDAAAK